MIGKFARLAKEGKPLTVHGDGGYLRDYIHVSDVAKAVVCAIESKVKNETFKYVKKQFIYFRISPLEMEGSKSRSR